MPKKATGEFTIDPTEPKPDLLETLASIDVATLDSTEWELLTQFCAKTLLAQVAKLDPRWERLIEAAKVETGMDEWKWLGSQLARVLENGQHLNVARHPYFEVGGGRVTEKQCEWKPCGQTFMPAYPGQRYHSNECGTLAFNEQRKAKQEEDDRLEEARRKRFPQRPITPEQPTLPQQPPSRGLNQEFGR